MLPNGIVGIRREDITEWERRAPLSPDQVKQLTEQGIKFIVQPSYKRCFHDAAYVDAGAEINEDLSAAGTIIGVKSVPSSLLIPDRSYLFFSHTIKAQLDNMPLLDSVLEKNIRLVDYECITQGGVRGGKRLVAFGTYAGMAGMVDFLHGLGQRLLMLGYSTPFLKVAQSFTYKSVAEAKTAVQQAGEDIKAFGLPDVLGPFTFVFTGRGNVSRGAQEIFSLLPHVMVPAGDFEQYCSEENKPAWTGGKQLIGCVVNAEDCMVPVDGGKYVREDYYAHPYQYRSVFAEKFLPLASVVVNGIYWEKRFPRIITNQDLRELRRSGNEKLVGISEITCDLDGSVECLQEYTSIDEPFFVFDPETGSRVEGVRGSGVVVLAVDQLPTEFAEDATKYFGQQLKHLLKDLVTTPTSVPADCSLRDLTLNHIPAEWRGAVIAVDGQLTPTWATIAKERAVNERAAAAARMKRNNKSSSYEEIVVMKGHLFDSTFINRALDLVESEPVVFKILDWKVGADASEETRVTLKVIATTQAQIDAVYGELTSLAGSAAFRKFAITVEKGADQHPTSGPTKVAPAHSYPASHARSESTGSVVDHQASHLRRTSNIGLSVPKGLKMNEQLSVAKTTITTRVLVLGAGFVAGPMVEYILRVSPHVGVMICSHLKHEAVDLAARHSAQATAVELDVSNPEHLPKLEDLVAQSAVVVSLVPAPFHPIVARACIKLKRHLVTASYVSPEMQALHDEAVAAGITIINEAGLDPGLDHMSAMEVIHKIQRAGGKLMGFQSLCGGLPAPEAADNPLAYKFSWSPRGVLTASQNSAKYRKNGKIVEVDGSSLLQAAEPMDVGMPFAIECLPNRDSLAYAPVYGIEDAETVFRGTLRYSGFSVCFGALIRLGLGAQAPIAGVPSFDAEGPVQSWAYALLAVLAAKFNCPISIAALKEVGTDYKAKSLETAAVEASKRYLCDEKLSAVPAGEVGRVLNAMIWLGLTSSSETVPRQKSGQPIDALCTLLTEKLKYLPGERDLALMHHRFQYQSSAGEMREIRSTLCVYGNKQASAMAQTVGYTAAACAELILEKKVSALGIVRPLIREIYEPVLEVLANLDIKFVETDLPYSA